MTAKGGFTIGTMGVATIFGFLANIIKTDNHIFVFLRFDPTENEKQIYVKNIKKNYNFKFAVKITYFVKL